MKWKKVLDYKKCKVTTGNNFVQWQIKKNKPCYSGAEIKGCDIDTFEVLEDFEEKQTIVSRDKNHIYYAWSKLKTIDRDSFMHLGDNYWKDRSNVFAEYETSIKLLKGSNVESFKYLGNGYAFDKNYAYHRGRYIKSCKNPTTLQIIKGGTYACFAKDVDNVYYGGTKLNVKNIESWEVINDFYSRDEKSIFYMKHKLPKVDLESWEYLGYSYSKDKNNVYRMFLVEKGENPKYWTKEKVIEIEKSLPRV